MVNQVASFLKPYGEKFTYALADLVNGSLKLTQSENRQNQDLVQKTGKAALTDFAGLLLIAATTSLAVGTATLFSGSTFLFITGGIGFVLAHDLYRGCMNHIRFESEFEEKPRETIETELKEAAKDGVHIGLQVGKNLWSHKDNPFNWSTKEADKTGDISNIPPRINLNGTILKPVWKALATGIFKSLS